MLKRSKLAALAAVLTAAALIFTGCTGSATPAPTPEPAATAATAAPTATPAATATAAAATAAPAPPAETGRKALTIMFPDQPILEDVFTNYATGWLEDRMDVDLDFYILPNVGWQDVFEVMVAANEKLPDLVFGSSSANFVATHAANGVFIDITPLYEEYGVHMKAALESDAYAMSQTVFPDGKMYSVPRVQYQTHTEYSPKFFLNEVWMNNLGLQIPETYEGLVDVFRAFRDDDPNGNGLQDEIPISGHKDELPFNFLMGSFTFVNGAHNLQVNDAGVLNACYTTDGWRNGLRAFNALWEEGGILDPMMFTQDNEQLRAVAQREGDTILGAVIAMNSTMPFQNAIEKAHEFVGTPPFAGPDGTRYTAYSPPSVTYNGQITKYCEDPVFAFQFMDNTYELETTMVIRYGEQGVDWDWLPEGSKGILTESMGIPATFSLLSTVQTGVQNKWWHVWSPLYIPYSIGDGWPWLDDVARVAMDAIGILYGYVPDKIVGRILYTPDEMGEINEILSNLNNYRNEARSLFILGDMDVEKDWDAYLAELNSIGLPKYLEVTQAAYERMPK